MKSSPRRRSSDRKQTISSRSGGSQTLNVSRTSDQKVCIDAKENVDLALEINITTGPNVQVNKLFKIFVVFICKWYWDIFFSFK